MSDEALKLLVAVAVIVLLFMAAASPEIGVLIDHYADS